MATLYKQPAVSHFCHLPFFCVPICTFAESPEKCKDLVVRTLRGTGNPELLANEMKWYNLSIVAVTETHLASEGEMPLDKEGRYIFLSLKDRMVGTWRE